jgi:hypothetical protein
MKFLDFKSFAELVELCDRQNGKTTEAIKAALNILINYDDRCVTYVGANQNSCDYARAVALDILENAAPFLRINIIRDNSNYLEFTSLFGRSVLRFLSWRSIYPAIRGCTLDEIIFDVDLGTMFMNKFANDGKNLATEIHESVAPTMAHRKNPIDHTKIIKIL